MGTASWIHACQLRDLPNRETSGLLDKQAEADRWSMLHGVLVALYRVIALLACGLLIGAWVYSQTDAHWYTAGLTGSGKDFYRHLGTGLAGTTQGKPATPLGMLLLPLGVLVVAGALWGVQ